MSAGGIAAEKVCTALLCDLGVHVRRHDAVVVVVVEVVALAGRHRDFLKAQGVEIFSRWSSLSGGRAQEPFSGMRPCASHTDWCVAQNAG